MPSWKINRVPCQPLLPAFARSELFDALQNVEPARSYFKDEEVLRERTSLSVVREWTSLSVEKAAPDATFSVGSEVETVSIETISKSFSISLLNSEEIDKFHLCQIKHSTN